ncbi:hypothetical protein M2189_002357 [Bradyrhizobium japonicum]|nr:hypothetical protein [Bradyrhizobium japonicum]MCS3959154.1 hypothetical protein [Bradyrhizobium japonicum]MCS4000909.1 hypothetical protein [Bradyrhizobium japonicum]
MMNKLASEWWPFGLLVGGAVLLSVMGYSWRDTGAITFMALLVAGAGGYIVAIERQKRR